jgi:hypothetical protein
VLVDWNERASRVVAEFRADRGPHLDDPPTLRLLETLKSNSSVFARLWEDQDSKRAKAAYVDSAPATEKLSVMSKCLFRFVRLLCSGHQSIVIENAALRLQLRAFQRTRRRPVDRF